MTAGFTTLANPGTKTNIFAYLFRLPKPGYVEHLRSKLPGNYILYARMRFTNLYSPTMTLTTEYLAKFSFDLAYLLGKELVFIVSVQLKWDKYKLEIA
jgi:hypothetical protein